MFKRNEEYRQYSAFGITSSLSEKKSKMLSKSIEHIFLMNIFTKIKESDFIDLYSQRKSRPNTPVNQLVGSLILKHLNNWTYEELFKNLNFNLLTRHAIGIDTIEEEVFSEATIFNFQNKVIEHYVSTGQDLLTEVFDNLTQKQLDEFGIKTNIQRGDSFLIGSNIFDYTRLQLLIETLLRVSRIIDDIDKKTFSEIIIDYSKQTSGQYIYNIQRENLPKEISKLSKIYHEIFTKFKDKYSDVSVFRIFERVYYENFVIKNKKVEVIPSNQLNSSILMSPDDQQATYRDKGQLGKKGYSGHISETANPENKINFITDCVVVQNNIDDARILEDRLPEMIAKTPDLSEYHADGNYGSPSVDKIMEAHSIIQIQSSMRGRKAFAKMDITEGASGVFWVTCEGGQKIKAEKTQKGRNPENRKVVFNYEKCLQCFLKDKCKSYILGLKVNRPKRVWYFSDEKIRLQKRLQNTNEIPESRRKLRANVEATVKEAKRGVKNGKVRIRGKVRIKFYLSMTSIAVNLTRIHKYLNERGLLEEKRLAFLQGICSIVTKLKQIRSFFQGQNFKHENCILELNL